MQTLITRQLCLECVELGRMNRRVYVAVPAGVAGLGSRKHIAEEEFSPRMVMNLK